MVSINKVEMYLLLGDEVVYDKKKSQFWGYSGDLERVDYWLDILNTYSQLATSPVRRIESEFKTTFTTRRG